MGECKTPIVYVIIIILRLNKVIIIIIILYFYAKYNYNYIFVKNMIIIHHKQITGKRNKCTCAAKKKNSLFELKIK